MQMLQLDLRLLCWLSSKEELAQNKELPEFPVQLSSDPECDLRSKDRGTTPSLVLDETARDRVAQVFVVQPLHVLGQTLWGQP